MIKTMALVCAAVMTFSASGIGMHQAGWFDAKTPRSTPTHEVRNSDPLHSEAAMRFRTNQTTNWRLVMTIR